MRAYKSFIYKVVTILNPNAEMAPTIVLIETMFQIERKFSMVSNSLSFHSFFVKWQLVIVLYLIMVSD